MALKMARASLSSVLERDLRSGCDSGPLEKAHELPCWKNPLTNFEKSWPAISRGMSGSGKSTVCHKPSGTTEKTPSLLMAPYGGTYVDILARMPAASCKKRDQQIDEIRLMFASHVKEDSVE